MAFRYPSTPTNFGGAYFRSTLEARWAATFKEFGIQWHYEAESFDLCSGTYLPDFWLSDLNVWVEVKPDYRFADTERYKELVQQIQSPFILLVGKPKLGEYCIRYFAVEDNVSIGLILQGQFAQLNESTQLWVAQNSIAVKLRSGAVPRRNPSNLVVNSQYIVQCMDRANRNFDQKKLG